MGVKFFVRTLLFLSPDHLNPHVRLYWDHLNWQQEKRKYFLSGKRFCHYYPRYTETLMFHVLNLANLAPGGPASFR